MASHERHSLWNIRQIDCFIRVAQTTFKVNITSIRAENPPVIDGFPAQKVNDTERISMPWRISSTARDRFPAVQGRTLARSTSFCSLSNGIKQVLVCLFNISNNFSWFEYHVSPISMDSSGIFEVLKLSKRSHQAAQTHGDIISRWYILPPG